MFPPTKRSPPTVQYLPTMRSSHPIGYVVSTYLPCGPLLDYYTTLSYFYPVSSWYAIHTFYAVPVSRGQK